MTTTTALTTANQVIDQILNIRFVEIPAGEFMMGSPDDDELAFDDEKPQHRVVFDHSFYMSETTINQAQWRWVVQNLPKVMLDLNESPSRFSGDELPVEQVSWYEVMEFCLRLAIATGRHITLPTEAQWEYACRAGTTTRYSFGDTITKDQVNFYQEGYPAQTVDPYSLPCNQWGLYSMHGNVWEWVLDSYFTQNYEGAPDDGFTVWRDPEDTQTNNFETEWLGHILPFVGNTEAHPQINLEFIPFQG